MAGRRLPQVSPRPAEPEPARLLSFRPDDGLKPSKHVVTVGRKNLPAEPELRTVLKVLISIITSNPLEPSLVLLDRVLLLICYDPVVLF